MHANKYAVLRNSRFTNMHDLACAWLGDWTGLMDDTTAYETAIACEEMQQTGDGKLRYDEILKIVLDR